jgi:transposase
MCLHPRESFPVPEETRRVAQAAFPKGTLCLQIGDHLGTIYQDRQFTASYPARGQPDEAPARLAMVTVLQFIG